MPAPVDITDPFRALADPTRRAVLDLLAGGALPVQAIAGRFPAISRPAVSKHLRVLREGGLVTEKRSGRERYYRVEPEAVQNALDWMRGVYRQALDDRRSAQEAPKAKRARPPQAARSGSTRSKLPASQRPRPAPPGTPRKTPAPSRPPGPATEGDDWKAW